MSDLLTRLLNNRLLKWGDPDKPDDDDAVVYLCWDAAQVITRLTTALAGAKREWCELAVYIANHLDEECADAEWSDINGSFDPWQCIRDTAAAIDDARDGE